MRVQSWIRQPTFLSGPDFSRAYATEPQARSMACSIVMFGSPAIDSNRHIWFGEKEKQRVV